MSKLDPRGLEAAGQAIIDYFNTRFEGTKHKPKRGDWNQAAAESISAYFQIPDDEPSRVDA
jgi:hypothetical protein